jgi:outer membrane protein OmpA-like peptidoglycan-associated protein
MKTGMLLTSLLAAALVIPAAAQQTTTSDTQQPAASSQSSSSTATQNTTATSEQDLNSDQNMSARQPLQPETRQGFWGKINPMARKKYVQRQLSPIRNRVNELDDLTAANARQIRDVDARAQEGIRQADAKATQADQHAVDAGNRAQQANQTAMQASNRLNTVEQVVGNLDQYQTATQTEIRYRAGQTALSTKAKQALDDMTANLKDQKGYVIEVQGFSTGAGQAGVRSSQAMANAVVRYLVENADIPVYRIYVMGMGNAKLPDADGNTKAHGNRVEISLLKNSVDQLASAGTYNDNGAPASPVSYNAPATSGNTSQSAAQQPNMNPNPSEAPQQQ